MQHPYVAFDTKTAKGRVLIVALLLGVITMCWYGIRWQLGNMLAELTSPTDPRSRSISEVAVRLAPGDPLAQWLAASSHTKSYADEGMKTGIGMFEDVVRLSPYDYRWWIELGRAYERAEDFDNAEKAFRRAVELGPSYAYPHWQLGNFLLRRNRVDEAFAELKKTTENNLEYRDQVFSLAWDYFDKDPGKLEQNIADSPDVRARLTLFYAAHGQAADSLRVWNTLTPEQKSEYPQMARSITQGLFERHFYRAALEFSRQVGIDAESAPETVTNGGFEKPIGDAGDNFFGWKLTRNDNKLEVSVDPSVKHSGNRGLKLNFRTYVKPQLFNVVQAVTVQPLQSYRLTFWLRTEDLRSAGVPQVDVINGNDDRILATSQPFPTGSADWHEMSIEFRAPENCEGIVIRTSRVYCGDACPIVGTVWYDDFSISKR